MSISIHGINDSVCIRLTLGLPHGLAKLQMGGWPKTLYSPSFCLTDQEWTKNGDGYRLVRAPEIVSGCSPPRLQIVVYGGCVLGPRTCALSPSQLIGSSDTQIRCRVEGAAVSTYPPSAHHCHYSHSVFPASQCFPVSSASERILLSCV